MRKGFTLVELLIVVIVVAILATFAIPQYLKAVERAKEGKAKHAMSLIASGQKMYRAENDAYTAVAAGGHDAALGSYVELADVDADSDWSYATASAAADTFTITATRAAGGPNAGETIALDQDGTWTDNFTP
jgi:type IV pilus assembly protein PilE